ncbi:type VI secretion system contractile sheath large subunit [Aquabacterium sp. A7-Y]|uniref:type VI secretion system contractile sheath domain-containing protein n=1 Tax=Aquabacterium sp. A7-Y TaxID=1349605 RepID=UPI00223D56EE|nr:type VI secretion system contractile sheath large subunit [Aquabacterium sp. A7-Y]MCW7539691.1 type VI secretion system contractile sheath large subunit [Aquabacterium sp. A7-Y]
MNELLLDIGRLESTPPPWSQRRPLRIALLGDFSAGALAGRLDTGATLAARRPRDVSFDTLDEAIERAGLRLALPLGPDGSTVPVTLRALDDFHPDTLIRELPMFAALRELRRRLVQPSSFSAAAAELRQWAEDAGRPLSLATGRSGRAGAIPHPTAAGLDDFARLVQRPRTGRADGAATLGMDAALDALVRRAVGPFVRPAPSPQLAELLGAVDDAMGDTLRAVLHDRDFQQLESLWRGVDLLLRQLETGARLEVHLLDVSAEELAADLAGTNDLAETGLYRWLVSQPGEEAGGGYAAIAALHGFEPTPSHAALLGRLARVASHAGAPVFSAMTTDLLAERRKPPPAEVREALAALRRLPEAGFLCLAGPRFLLRHAYGRRTDPIASFDFEEFNPREGLRSLLWGHPALAALCAWMQDGGICLRDMPMQVLRDEAGDTTALPCTDRLIRADMAVTLREFGVQPLLAAKNEPMVRMQALAAVNGAPLSRAAGRPSLQAAAAPPPPPRVPAEADPAADGRSSGVETEDASATSSEDVSLDALLAELNGNTASDTPASEEAATAEPADTEVDAELAALLKSLD